MTQIRTGSSNNGSIRRNQYNVPADDGQTMTSGTSMLRVHHGALDTHTITTRAPPVAMKHVREVLQGMGVEIQLESEYRYRCIRVRREGPPAIGLGLQGSTFTGGLSTRLPVSGSAAACGVPPHGDATTALTTESPTRRVPVYGDVTQDPGDEVRFFVELTRLDGLNDTISLDIRRLKGNLRSYKFLYDTLRE